MRSRKFLFFYYINFSVYACRCVNDDDHFADELPFADLDTNDIFPLFFFVFLSGSGWRTTTTTRSLFFFFSFTLDDFKTHTPLSQECVCFVCVCVWDDLLCHFFRHCDSYTQLRRSCVIE
jgi:hypothetical protein